jgi:hypothetical protein
VRLLALLHRHYALDAGLLASTVIIETRPPASQCFHLFLRRIDREDFFIDAVYFKRIFHVVVLVSFAGPVRRLHHGKQTEVPRSRAAQPPRSGRSEAEILERIRGFRVLQSSNPAAPLACKSARQPAQLHKLKKRPTKCARIREIISVMDGVNEFECCHRMWCP